MKAWTFTHLGHDWRARICTLGDSIFYAVLNIAIAALQLEMK